MSKKNDPMTVLASAFGKMKGQVNRISSMKEPTSADYYQAKQAIQNYLETVLQLIAGKSIVQDPYGILHGKYFEEAGQADSWAAKTTVTLSEELTPKYLEAVTEAEQQKLEELAGDKNLTGKVTMVLRSGVKVVIDTGRKVINFIWGGITYAYEWCKQKVQEFCAFMHRQWDKVKSKFTKSEEPVGEAVPA